ncbi:MAG: glyoxalase superfamily protein [Chloroflexota bacterium]
MRTHAITPVLRILDEGKAKEFYVDFLEFDIEFEHRFQEDFPLYMGITKGSWVLHLTEHHGDCNSGAAVRLQMEGVKTFQQHLLDKKYKYARPGYQKTEWGTLEMDITDPFGNRLTFFELLAQETET